MMEQDSGTKLNRRRYQFSILGHHFSLGSSAVPRCWGKCARALSGIRDTQNHSPFMTLVVAQLVLRYCTGRHETK